MSLQPITRASVAHGANKEAEDSQKIDPKNDVQDFLVYVNKGASDLSLSNEAAQWILLPISNSKTALPKKAAFSKRLITNFLPEFGDRQAFVKKNSWKGKDAMTQQAIFFGLSLI